MLVSSPLAPIGVSHLPAAVGSRKKSANREEQRDRDRRPGHRAGELDVLLPLFLHRDVSRPEQRAHAEPERVPQHAEAPNEGPLAPLPGINGRGQRLFVHDDLAVRGAHRDGQLLPPAHHHAFDDCLSAVVEFSQCPILIAGPRASSEGGASLVCILTDARGGVKDPCFAPLLCCGERAQDVRGMPR